MKMAKLDDILKLQEAGFNAEDIAKLLPLVEEKPEVKPQVIEQKKAENSVDFDAINTRLNELVERLEANAILTTQQSENKARTLDDVLADIIEPKI